MGQGRSIECDVGAVASGGSRRSVAAGPARWTLVAGGLLAGAAVAWAAAGDLDTTFGTGGVASPALTLPGAALVGVPWRMAVQTVGGTERYLVTGLVDNDGDGYGDDWYVAAYTATGALDTSFGPSGTGVMRVFGTAKDPTVGYSRGGMTVDPQGRILRVGTSALVTTVVGKGNKTQTTSVPALTVARLTPDGRLDTTFNGTGIFRSTVSDRYANGVVVLSSGRIVVVATNLAGSGKKTWERLVLLGLQSDGTLDGGFGSSGVTYSTQPSSTVYCGVGVQSGDRVVVASRPGGSGVDANYQWLTTRFTPGGALDATFGSSGSSICSGMAQAALAIEPGTDAIVLSGTLFRGYGNDPTYNQLAVARMTAAGALDTSFGQGGLVDIAYPGANVYSAYTVEALGEGTVAASYAALPSTGTVSTFARLTASGALDPSFGDAGLGTYVSGHAMGSARSAAGLVLAGQPVSGPSHAFLARYQN